MTWFWAEGAHTPKGLSAEAMGEAIQQWPTPPLMFEASKDRHHILHAELWSEGDQVWANQARLDRTRHIMGACKQQIVIGKKTITMRAVEYIHRKDGTGAWATSDMIRSDSELLEDYLAEVQKLQVQAAEKISTVLALMEATRIEKPAKGKRKKPRK